MIVRNVGGRVLPDEVWAGPRLVVVSYDPGVTTGWSMIAYPVLSVAAHGVSRTLPGCEWEHGEIVRLLASEYNENSDSDHVDRILDKGRELYETYVNEDRGDAFVQVMERFDLRLMNSDQELLAPVRVMSVWKDRLRNAPVNKFYQTPSDAKRTVNDSRLAQWGMYDSHSGKHARDADRHNILFARRWAANRDVQKRVGLFLPQKQEAS